MKDDIFSSHWYEERSPLPASSRGPQDSAPTFYTIRNELAAHLMVCTSDLLPLAASAVRRGRLTEAASFLRELSRRQIYINELLAAKFGNHGSQEKQRHFDRRPPARRRGGQDGI